VHLEEGGFAIHDRRGDASIQAVIRVMVRVSAAFDPDQPIPGVVG
jgi:hypothetical protein